MMRVRKSLIKDYKLYEVLVFINYWKGKVKWIASLNPIMLYSSFILFIIIPYVPNIPLYLILVNKRINKYLKYFCLTLSIVATIFWNIYLLFYLIKK